MPAIAVVALDEGCVCYPDDRLQALCAQHLHRCSPIGMMEIVAGAWL